MEEGGKDEVIPDDNQGSHGLRKEMGCEQERGETRKRTTERESQRFQLHCRVLFLSKSVSPAKKACLEECRVSTRDKYHK